MKTCFSCLYSKRRRIKCVTIACESVGMILCRFSYGEKTHIFYISEVFRKKELKKVLFFTGGCRNTGPPGKFLKGSLYCKISAFFIFTRGSAFIFFKSADKITKIIKSISVGDVCYGIICRRKLVACLFNALTVQIIHRCLMSHL